MIDMTYIRKDVWYAEYVSRGLQQCALVVTDTICLCIKV